jgi:hypothetical protein
VCALCVRCVCAVCALSWRSTSVLNRWVCAVERGSVSSDIEPKMFAILRIYGCVGVWLCQCVGVWVCGCVGVWMCGCVGVWVCGCVGVSVCGCVGVWVCGCVGVWVCGCVGVSGSYSSLIRSPRAASSECALSSSRMHIVAYMLERKVNAIPSAFLFFFS